jgi:hypothetical protein
LYIANSARRGSDRGAHITGTGMKTARPSGELSLYVRYPVYAMVAAIVVFVLVAATIMPVDLPKSETARLAYEKARANGRDLEAVTAIFEACDWVPFGIAGWQGWKRRAHKFEFEACIRENGLTPD